MHYHFLAALFVLTTASSACRTPGSNAQLNGANTASTPAAGTPTPPLAASDFKTPLTKTFLRSINSDLDDATFAAKWSSSHTTPMMLLRAFPPAYYADSVQIPTEHRLGGETLCLGDAHPENFGFLQIDGETLFSFNDLDDSGYCGVGLDALRFFTALRLYQDDEALVGAVLDQYVWTVANRHQGVPAPAELLPDWAKIGAKELAKNTIGDHLVVDGKALIAATAADRQAISAVWAQTPNVSGWRLLDVAGVVRQEGGSGGLKRFHLLVEKSPGVRTIMEFKQAATPGTQFGKPNQILSFDARLPLLKSTFWHTNTQQDYFYVMVNGTRFLVRDRLHMQGVSLSDLSPVQLKPVLFAEVSVMAAIHAPALQNVATADLRQWLLASSDTIATRWRTLFQSTDP